MTNKLDEIWKKPDRDPPATNGHAIVTPITGASRYATKALDDELDRVRTAPNGQRNDTLNRAAFNLGTLVAAGHLTAATTIDALLSAGRAAGLGETETLRTIQSGLKSGQDHPRDVPPPAPAADVPDASVLEELQAEEDTFWGARPILWHLHQYARARRVSPWAVLGCTLARVVAATPPTVLLPPLVGGYASLNTFVGLVGRSGAGKGAAEAVSAEALNVGHLTTVKTGSGEGIAHGYMKRTKSGIEQHTTQVLFSVPEIDTLTALGNRQGATLLPELRSGWSGETLGFAYSDPAKRLPVPAHRYRMCLIAGIQPHRAAPLLNDSDAGTPQRFLWLPATDPDAPDRPPEAPERLTWERPVYGRMKGLTTVHGTAMDVCQEAHDTVDQARLTRLRGTGEALDGHALLAQLKAAAALALLDGRLEVTDDDWWLASIIAKRSAATRAGVTQALADAFKASNRGRAEAEAERAIVVSESLEDRAVKRTTGNIMKALRKSNGDEWTPSSAIRRSLNSRDREHYTAAIDGLTTLGIVQEETVPGHGDGSRYRLAESAR